MWRCAARLLRPCLGCWSGIPRSRASIWHWTTTRRGSSPQGGWQRWCGKRDWRSIAPTLSPEELAAVYQTAKTTDLDILRDAAVQMFPERFAEQPPHLYAHQGGAIAFQHHGVIAKPEYTIGAVPMNQIGVMADGMAYPY